MLIILAILILMQPFSILLGAWLYYRASQRQSPVPKPTTAKKISINSEDDGDRNHAPTRIPVRRSQ